jgi:hypothetical protein
MSDICLTQGHWMHRILVCVFNICNLYLPHNIGRAITQVVSRRLPTAAARVRVQVRSFGICGGQSGTRAGFLRVLRFPCHSHSTDCSTFIIMLCGVGTIGQLVADVISRLCLTPPQETKKKLKLSNNIIMAFT